MDSFGHSGGRKAGGAGGSTHHGRRNARRMQRVKPARMCDREFVLPQQMHQLAPDHGCVCCIHVFVAYMRQRPKSLHALESHARARTRGCSSAAEQSKVDSLLFCAHSCCKAQRSNEELEVARAQQDRTCRHQGRYSCARIAHALQCLTPNTPKKSHISYMLKYEAKCRRSELLGRRSKLLGASLTCR